MSASPRVGSLRERDGHAYQSLLVPLNALLLVGVCVRVALDGAGVAAEEAVEGGADLVAAVLLDGVALGAAGLEEVGTLLGITCAWRLVVCIV